MTDNANDNTSTDDRPFTRDQIKEGLLDILSTRYEVIGLNAYEVVSFVDWLLGDEK